jgi:hypothetical protein
VSREVTLTNTSEIPMTYQLRVSRPSSTGRGQPAGSPTTGAVIIGNSENSTTEASDFQIIPNSGTLPPNFHQTIQVVHWDGMLEVLVRFSAIFREILRL